MASKSVSFMTRHTAAWPAPYVLHLLPTDKV
jgi:hypothetical protein